MDIYNISELKYFSKKYYGIIYNTSYTCWWKNYYFDPNGENPPIEVIEYLREPIIFSTYKIEQYNDDESLEWCKYVLIELNNGNNFDDIMLKIINN